jgi:phospholipase D1/2
MADIGVYERPRGTRGPTRLKLSAGDRKKILWGVAIIAALVAAVSAAWRFTPLQEWVTAENVVEWVDTFSRAWWAPYAIALLYTPAAMVLFPRALLTVAAAVAFGPVKGFVIAMAGVLLSTVIGYFAGRQLDPDRVKRWGGPRMEKVRKGLRKEGFLAVATLGLVPIAPFSVLVVAFGALRLKLWQVLAGVALAHLPGTVGSTLMGDQVHAMLSADRTLNPVVIGGVVLTMVVVGITTHRLWKRMQPAFA